MPLGFTIAGGKESGFGIFISKVRKMILLYYEVEIIGILSVCL